MLPTTKLKTTILLASAVLLYTSPLAAALKGKPATRVKAQPTVHNHLSTATAHSTTRSSAKHATVHSTAASSRHSHQSKAHGDKVQVAKVPVAKVQVAKAAPPRFRGQQAIDQARTMEIQQALIREHYLDGDATGEWDQATRDALIRFQGDNHWQTKILPDARALIKLGLGPSQQNLLNPESAATAVSYQFEHSGPGGSN
jgi:hypothetical protein